MIFVDYELQDMNGLEIIHEIREVLKLEIPIILCSGDNSISEEATKKGANEFVIKPIFLK